MNKGDVESIIPEAKEQFVLFFPEAEKLIANTEICVILNGNRQKKRREIFERYGVKLREDEPAEGETIVGKQSAAVILYGSVIKNERRCKHVLWHELGHVLSNTLSRDLFEEAEADMEMDRDTLIKSGMAVWSEFIAEYIALLVEDEPASGVAWEKAFQMEQHMDAAVNSGLLQVYPLAFFFAMLLGDATICSWREANGYAVPGLNHCDEDIFPALKEITELLAEQVEQEEFAQISHDTLSHLGECVNALWDFCYMANTSRELQAFRDRLFD